MNKLVRDNIPNIILKNNPDGTIVNYYTLLDDKKFEKALEDKLLEEVNEYLESKEVVELADIMEVVLALAKLQNVDFNQLNKIREEKNLKNGSFNNRIFLDYVSKGSSYNE